MEIREDLLEAIRKGKFRRVLLQAPEGLKTEVAGMAEEIERSVGCEAVIWSEPCYGACDIPEEAAKMAKCDAIIHLGHESFGVKSKIPVIYYPIEYDMGIPENLRDEIGRIKEEEVAIYSSVQFRKALNELEAVLEKAGKRVLDKKTILGCSEIKTNAEASIFIGSGKFHPLALKGKVYQLDLERGKIVDLSDEIKREEMKRAARLEKLKDARKVGILVSKKQGQFYKDFDALKKRLKREGKTVKTLLFDEITNEKLLGLDFDAYINTACPRILDNHFDRPVINVRDI